jgi:hypothetical protein
MQDKLRHIVCSALNIGSNALLATIYDIMGRLRNNQVQSMCGSTSVVHREHRPSDALSQCEMPL